MSSSCVAWQDLLRGKLWPGAVVNTIPPECYRALGIEEANGFTEPAACEIGRTTWSEAFWETKSNVASVRSGPLLEYRLQGWRWGADGVRSIGRTLGCYLAEWHFRHGGAEIR